MASAAIGTQVSNSPAVTGAPPNCNAALAVALCKKYSAPTCHRAIAPYASITEFVGGVITLLSVQPIAFISVTSPLVTGLATPELENASNALFPTLLAQSAASPPALVLKAPPLVAPRLAEK